MTEWHRTWRGDLGLRALGLGACALSYLSIRHLMALHDAHPAHWSPGMLPYALTAIGFLGASSGSAMTIMGRHLFDQVEISERWRRRPDGSSPSSIGPTGFRDVDFVNLSDPTALGPWGRRDPSIRREDANLLLRRSSASSASMRLQVARPYGLHSLAVEDALKDRQLPNVDVYGDQLFVIARPASLEYGLIVYGQTAVSSANRQAFELKGDSSSTSTTGLRLLQAQPS